MTITNVVPFVFEGENSVRVLIQGGDPWFVAADVCRAVGIVNHRDAVERLDEDEKGVGSTDTLGGAQEMVIISESGLYTLVLRSRDAVTPGSVAHRFRRWVTGEVLPQIRQTGRYEAGNRLLKQKDLLIVERLFGTNAARRLYAELTGRTLRDVEPSFKEKRDLLILAERLFGAEAGRQLYFQLNMPTVAAMNPPQGDMFRQPAQEGGK